METLNQLSAKYLLLCIAFAITYCPGFTQSGETQFLQTLSFTGRFHFGSFLTQNGQDQYVKDSYTYLGELDISTQTTGKKNWQQLSNYPEIGIGLLYGKSGSNSYIGNVAAIFSYIDFPLIKSGSFKTCLRLGIGPGWVEKPFNAETNYKNLLIGTHLNACFNFQLYSEFRVQRYIKFNLGFAFIHFSNGSIKLPNEGLNIPALSAGLTFSLTPQLKFERKNISPFKKKINYYLFGFVAAKESYPLESAVYLVNIFNAEVLKDFSYTGRFGGGINLTYDRALSKEVVNSVVYAFDKSKPKYEVSLYGAYEYVIGRMSIPLQIGVYLYNNYPVQAIYETIGLKYRLSDHWIIGTGLKTHLGNGDFIQWGLGYKF